MEGEIVVYSGNWSNFYVESPPSSVASSGGANKLLGDSVSNNAQTCYGDEEVVDKCYDEEIKEEDGSGRPSFVWMAIQLCWKLLFSLVPALLVFYLLTKPKASLLSVQGIDMEEFEIEQGVDSSGIATGYLSINISMLAMIENKSQVYRVHTTTPVLEIFFGPLPLAISKGAKVYGRCQEHKTFRTYVGIRKEATYGGGRNMQDMLHSQQGLPLVVTLTFNSYYRVVGALIRPVFHHHARCLLFIHSFYDPALRPAHPYNSTCLITS
ncbi:uncharacterized protein LOC141621163 [Silene latifolia]|uniref:uncharacterized protein LOC141621163 n=1 Tax=Silene latifolia TaxID=37657 RepID=UPI003D76FFF6